MIAEDFVSFETAKLLKEKGFNEYCRYFYTLRDEGREGYKSNERLEEFAHNSHVEIKGRAVSCPTPQMAMKWLRKVHNLHCDIGYDDLDWFWNVLNVSESVPVEERPMMIKNGFAGFKSYEEACEAAIKYCLENLV